MDAMLKTAADHLLKIADDLDREAAEKTVFCCGKCSHSATLGSMNATVAAALKAVGSKKASSFEPITVNDRVACSKCDGVMSYRPTKASEAYYVQSSDKKDSAMLKEGPKSPVELEAEERQAAIKAPESPSIPPAEVEPQQAKKTVEPPAIEPRVEHDSDPSDSDPDDQGSDPDKSDQVSKLASAAGIDISKLGAYLSYGG